MSKFDRRYDLYVLCPHLPRCWRWWWRYERTGESADAHLHAKWFGFCGDKRKLTFSTDRLRIHTHTRTHTHTHTHTYGTMLSRLYVRVLASADEEKEDEEEDLDKNDSTLTSPGHHRHHHRQHAGCLILRFVRLFLQVGRSHFRFIFFFLLVFHFFFNYFLFADLAGPVIHLPSSVCVCCWISPKRKCLLSSQLVHGLDLQHLFILFHDRFSLSLSLSSGLPQEL